MAAARRGLAVATSNSARLENFTLNSEEIAEKMSGETKNKS